MSGVIAADIYANNHLAADRFRVRVAASVAPLDELQQPGSRVGISIGLGGGWTSLVMGTIDSIVLDPVQGVLDFEGRDLSSMMIESRVDETFANRTSSEIAQTIAGRHGLGASVEQTSTPVGRYYQSEHDRLTLGQFAKATTEWDLLAFLANKEGFDLFMDGDTLRFGPTDESDPVELQKEDCISLQLEHSLGLARQIEVTVRSWGTRAGSSVVQTATGGNGGTTWRHGITRPNLTADDAQRLADQTLADLARHEWIATISLPGELTMTPRSTVALVGTGTEWDRTYEVSEVTRHLDVRRGFTQRLALQGVP